VWPVHTKSGLQCIYKKVNFRLSVLSAYSNFMLVCPYLRILILETNQILITDSAASVSDSLGEDEFERSQSFEFK